MAKRLCAFIIVILAVAQATAHAQVQLVRAAAGLFFNYKVNEAFARGGKRETPAATLLMNNWFIESARDSNGNVVMKKSQIPGWDTGLPYDIYYDCAPKCDVLLQPILFKNGGGSPREYEYYVNDRLVYVTKFHGGRRTDHGVEDNSGPEGGNYCIPWSTLPDGWNTIMVKTGTPGETASCKFQKLHMDTILPSMANENVQRTMAGIGTVTSPQFPTYVGAASDGTVVTGVSQADVEQKVEKLNSQQPITDPNGQPLDLAPKTIQVKSSQEIPASAQLTGKHFPVVVKAITKPINTWGELDTRKGLLQACNDVTTQPSLNLGEGDALPLSADSGTFVAFSCAKHFQVLRQAVDANGNWVTKQKFDSIARKSGFIAFLGFTYEPNESQSRVLLVTDEGQEQTIDFSEEK